MAASIGPAATGADLAVAHAAERGSSQPRFEESEMDVGLMTTESRCRALPYSVRAAPLFDAPCDAAVGIAHACASCLTRAAARPGDNVYTIAARTRISGASVRPEASPPDKARRPLLHE